MSNRNNLVFKGLYMVAWVIFVGLCIEAGGLIVNFVFGANGLSLGKALDCQPEDILEYVND